MVHKEVRFVLTFFKVGIPGAAGIINFVVLTAALSSCNSGIFSTARMLYSLADENLAPSSMQNVGSRGVPTLAVALSAGALLIGVVLNYLVPQKVFTWVTSIATFGAIWTWIVILIAQLKFRRSVSSEELNNLSYRMPLWPYGSYLALAFLVGVIVLMGYSPDTRIALIVGPLWIVLLVAVYYGKGLHKLPTVTREQEEVNRTAG